LADQCLSPQVWNAASQIHAIWQQLRTNLGQPHDPTRVALSFRVPSPATNIGNPKT
jgi:hypothetical protein